MKKLLLILLFLPLSVYPQFNDYPRPNEGLLTGGLGLNWIDGDLYYSLGFRPEISFLNFGVGLDLRLDINKDGIRKENFNEFSDYLSIIRYARYGLKNDPLYVKLGALDYHTIGHGSIMYQYNNSPSYDVRKTGLILDIDFGSVGFESIYSKFGEAGVVGLRGYVRPLQFTSLASIPIISKLEFGFTYAGDFDQYSGVVNGTFNPALNKFDITEDESPVSIIGADVGLPVLDMEILDVDIYYDFAKILNFGNGSAAGIILNLNTLGLVTAQAKLERRFNGDNYIPSYFNSLYEIEKFKIDTSLGAVPFMSKARILKYAENMSDGYYGELGVNVMGLFYVLGSYQRLDKNPESGILHLGTEIAPESMPFVARAGYDKINIKNESDVFKLDDRSYLFFELGYKPVEYILVSMVYNWTFTPVRDADDKILSYEPIKRIEPRVSFIYPFGFGK